jgi:protein O-mannosyl-transferase
MSLLSRFTMPRKNRTRKPVVSETAVTKPAISQNWIIGLILGLTFLAFANSIENGFAYDDRTQILQNESIRSFSNIPLVLTRESWFWRVLQDKDPNKEEGPTTPYYRPLAMIYLMIGWSLFHLSPAGWHLMNILVHMIAVYFVFRIVHRITGETALSAVATILFAIHPLRCESVAWVSGATDLLLAVFMFPSFYLYLLYRDTRKKTHLVGSVLLFLLAAFAKEPAIMLPFFIFLYETLIENQDRSLRERLKPAVIYSSVYLLMSVTYFAMRLKALGFVLNDKGFADYSPEEVLMTIPLVICKYLGLLFWPVNLSLFHATPMVKDPLSLRLIIPTIVLMAICVALWPLRRSRVARFAILWFAVNMLPVLNLGAFMWEFNVQERYLYVPSVGFSLLLAMGLLRIPVEEWFTMGKRAFARGSVIAVVSVLFIVKTASQNTVWADDMTLWNHGVEAAPDQTMPFFILGHKYLNQRRMDRVIEYLEKYMELDSGNVVVINNLAAAHLVSYQDEAAVNPANADTSHLDRLIELCKKALQLDQHNAQTWDTLGTAFTFDTKYKSLDDAIRCFDRALQEQPRNNMARFHMGATLFKRNAFDESIKQLEQVAREQPDIPDVYKFLAFAYKATGKLQQAADNFDQYLRRQPNAPDAAMINKTADELRTQLKNAQPQS